MKIRTRQALFLIITGQLLFTLGACSKKEEAPQVQDYTYSNGVITLTENTPLHQKIKIAKVEKALTQLDQQTSGMVQAIPALHAGIASPFPGRITKSFVQLGQNVQKGSPIFEISSSDFFQAQQHYFTSVQEMKQAQAHLNRQKDLVAHGVGVQRELEEAQTAYEISRIAVENENAGLKMFNVQPGQLRMGQGLIVRSPLAGKVIANDVVLGQFLKEDAEALVQVADLSKVWIVAKVKENDLHVLKNLTDIQFRISAFPEQVFTGKVVHIQDQLNSESRSVDVMIETKNTDQMLRPGMYVEVTLKQEKQERIVVPAQAVFLENTTQFVYVQKSNNAFAKQKVTTATLNADQLIVLSGLHEEDQIVVEGGMYLLQAK